MATESKIAKQRLINIDKELTVNLRPALAKMSWRSNLVLVVIPQLHLSPYVYAFLLAEGLLIKRNIILIYNRSQFSTRELYNSFPNIIQLDIRYALNSEDEYMQRFLSVLRETSAKISCLVLHNFAGSINRRFAEIVTESKDNMSDHQMIDQGSHIFYYADGSRNNPLPEIQAQKGNDFYRLHFFSDQRRKLISFGFRHSSIENTRNGRIVNYDYVNAAFMSLKGLFRMSTSRALPEKQCSMVLTRYWGRDPYFFKDNQEFDLNKIFVEAITKKISPDYDLILRTDNRFTVEADAILTLLSQRGFTAFSFSELFDSEIGDIDTVLLESFIIDNPSILEKIRQFYSFDSSFPLVFQNRSLYSALPHNAELYVGFPKELVFQHGLEECYSVMKKRTIETVLSIFECGIFNIFDQKSLLLAPSVPAPDPAGAIEESFARGDGYFILRKP